MWNYWRLQGIFCHFVTLVRGHTQDTLLHILLLMVNGFINIGSHYYYYLLLITQQN